MHASTLHPTLPLRHATRATAVAASVGNTLEPFHADEAANALTDGLVAAFPEMFHAGTASRHAAA